MIFSQYKDSVYEITEMLQNSRPLCRPMKFTGKHEGGSSAATTNKKRFTQKDQMMVSFFLILLVYNIFSDYILK